MYSFALEKKMTISIKRLFIVAFLAFVLVSCVIISIISAFSITKIGTASAVNQASSVVEKALEILNGDEFERISKEMNPNDEKAEKYACRTFETGKINQLSVPLFHDSKDRLGIHICHGC